MRHLPLALFSSGISSFTWDRPFLTTNRFLLVQNPIDEHPYIQLREGGPKLTMLQDMTLKDLERELKQKGEAKKEANFIASDGALIAKSTKLYHLLHQPYYFVIKLDGHREFNVMSERSFSLRN